MHRAAKNNNLVILPSILTKRAKKSRQRKERLHVLCNLLLPLLVDPFIRGRRVLAEFKENELLLQARGER